MRVLLVDDDPLVLEALGLLLEVELEVETEHDDTLVTTRDSVAAALELVDRGRFDVVIADLRMPDRWGDELLAYVQARSPATRRLLLTGDHDPERTVRELIDQGVVDACFRKPGADGLIAAIRGLRAPPAPTGE